MSFCELFCTMGKLCGVVCLLLLGTSSAIKLFGGDYEEYSDLKQGEDVASAGHWRGQESDHVGAGGGREHHHNHYLDNAGEVEEGANKVGGHIKHHVTKGFKNFHHKNEVGQTTRYIDSSGDSGDHHGKHFHHSQWGDHGQADTHGNQHESGFKGETGAIEKNISKEKKENEKVGTFLYAKKPISFDKRFYSHVPLQYVPYPHYFY